MNNTPDVQQDPDLTDSFVSLIKNPKATKPLTEALNLGVDAFLDSGLLANVPIVSWIVKAVKAGLSIRSFLFLRKVAKFVTEYSTLDESFRREFAAKLESDPAFRRRVGDTLILLLERLDDLEKPELLARAFRRYVEGGITFEVFRRLGFAIDRCLVEDLLRLKQIGGPDWQLGSSQILAGSGLLEAEQGVGGKNYYRITDLGNLFVEIVIEN